MLVIFWGVIIYGRSIALVHVSVTMTGQFYIDLLIRHIVQPIQEEVGPNFVFIDNNARPHLIETVQNVLGDGENEKIGWRPHSSEMNPIARVWD